MALLALIAVLTIASALTAFASAQLYVQFERTRRERRWVWVTLVLIAIVMVSVYDVAINILDFKRGSFVAIMIWATSAGAIYRGFQEARDIWRDRRRGKKYAFTYYVEDGQVAMVAISLAAPFAALLFWGQ